MNLPTAKKFRSLPPDKRDDLAERLECEIYYCPECDNACRNDHRLCPRFPKEHDETGYMGTGTNYAQKYRELAVAIATDR